MLVPIAVNLVLSLTVFTVIVGGLAWSIRSATPRPEVRVIRLPRPVNVSRHGARRPA